MNDFIEGRAKLARELASKADPFTRMRLLRLAERHERELGIPSKAVREIEKTMAALPSGGSAK